jgi:hypothetical protein
MDFPAVPVQIQPGLISSLTVIVVWLIGTVLLYAGYSSLKGSTLVAPWIWCHLVWTLTAAVEVYLGGSTFFGGDPSVADWRYLVAMAWFCPQMSQMGAKRPQDVAWQWVVLSLWAVLCLPLLNSILLPGNPMVDVGPVWSWFLLILIGLGLLNNGPTRFGFAAILVALTQIVLVWQYLPWTEASTSTTAVLLAQLSGLAAIILVSLNWPPSRETLCPEDRAWLDFRDSFGAFWAARVMLRVNDCSMRYGWGLWLNWTGFARVEIVGSGPEWRDEIDDALNTALRNLLRRFVSDSWLDERIPRPRRKNRAGLEDLAD